MAVAAPAPKMTAEEFFALPGELPHPQLIDTAADVVLVFRRRTPDAATFDIALELTTADTLMTPLIEGWTIDLGALFLR